MSINEDASPSRARPHPSADATALRRCQPGRPTCSRKEKPLTASYLYDAVPTPFGRYSGALARTRPDDLAAAVLRALASRSPSLDLSLIDDVVLGDANGAGEDNRDLARMALLLAGYPVSVPGATVNRLCGSSLEAAILASRAVDAGDAHLVIAGGVESVSLAPWVMPKPERGFAPGDARMYSATLGWRMTNPVMPTEWTVSIESANEQIGEQLGITRRRQDEFALSSHYRADHAWQAGYYGPLVCPVPGSALSVDEGLRPDADVDTLAALSPAFSPQGTITAGNASPLSDGASAVLIGSSDAAELVGAEPQARIAARTAVALEPHRFGLAPIEAANLALTRAGIAWSDVAAVELNEAFAVQALACIDSWPIDAEIVNGWGGAIAIGHPLGASGTRLLGTLLARLEHSGGRWGIATLCIGVEQALAVVVENLHTDRSPLSRTL